MLKRAPEPTGMQLSAAILVCGSYTSPFGLFSEFAQFERFLENVLQSAAKLVEPGSQRDSITLCLRVPTSTRCDVYHCLSAWQLSPAWLSSGRGSLRQRPGTLPHSEGKAGRWGLCSPAVQGSSCFLAQRSAPAYTGVSPPW